MKEIILQTKVKVCPYGELSDDDRFLVDAARNAARNSYAPYSRFNVGAAVELESGTILSGNNQENVAYPSGLCAERVVLFNAGANYPDRAVKSMAIAARTADGELSRPIVPCGACRQVMLEMESRHKSAMRIVLYGRDGCYIIEGGAKELLPLSFDTDFLS